MKEFDYMYSTHPVFKNKLRYFFFRKYIELAFSLPFVTWKIRIKELLSEYFILFSKTHSEMYNMYNAHGYDIQLFLWESDKLILNLSNELSKLGYPFNLPLKLPTQIYEERKLVEYVLEYYDEIHDFFVLTIALFVD